MPVIIDRRSLESLCRQHGVMLQPPALNQLYLQITKDEALWSLSQQLCNLGFYPITLVGTDERELSDHCFKLTYLFSHPGEDIFLFVENPLQSGVNGKDPGPQSAWPNGTAGYISLYDKFKAIDPFEHELVDMLGVYPYQRNGQLRNVNAGAWLHEECYPAQLYPLCRDQTTAQVRAKVESYRCQGVAGRIPLPAEGEWLLPVGPVHAGVIEPGLFLFRLGGEVVEEMMIRLGYTHKGTERLFQTDYSLADGWRLAEHVSGDSSFAHSLAYCQAAEALAKVSPPAEAELLRGLFLELERMANHIGDCGALAHDVAYSIADAELTSLRERLLRLCEYVAGHRLLRGRNRPGGLVLPRPLDIAQTARTVKEVAAQFANLALYLAQLPAFRDRLQWIGILTRQQALDLGVTGLVARASGVRRDFRLEHPAGVYRRKAVQELVTGGLPPAGTGQAREATAGDALARFLIRMYEVASSAKIIEYILAQPELHSDETRFLTPVEFQPARNFEFGLGYVEGWRGDIIYWLMQDKFGRIFRCQVRDPSMLNWPALKAAVEPHSLEDDYIRDYRPPRKLADSILPDFPVINKSFDLSYSGNDL